MPDFSTSFFLSNSSDNPAYPPARFRLPNGQSRYSSSCALEDLQAIGLQGPLEIPDKQPDEVIKWSSDLKKFVATPVEESELEKLKIDKFVRTVLKDILNTKQDFLIQLNHCYEEYVKEKALYYCKIEAALSSIELLTFADIPAEVTCVSCEKELKFHYQDYKNCHYDSWRKSYETYGIIINMEDKFKPYFEVDSSWVKGSQPLPDALKPPFAFDFRDA